ncbi:bacteriophage abortive infection AbiH family protein [Sinorhizobium fredii]|uniref:bacteriophage abortive infection AbiH family protein n=1 Tax=Rhizobium fredii TaxID=380 RepID=UPI00339B8F80
MGSTLYIIGNGFDLHHGIASSYKAFGQFLRERDRDTYDKVDRYFSVDDDFWYEFEDRLATLNSDSLIDDASVFLTGYGADDWSDSAHGDYQYEINEVVEAISTRLRARFADWIRQLRLPSPTDIANIRLPIDPSAIFLNFNYTSSLQQLYSVPDSQVLHIHGSAANPTETLILGHGWEPEANLDPYRIYADPEDADMRVVEGQGLIDDYFKETFKPTEAVIESNAPFFARLSGVTEIFVMGHSVSSVDHPYFYEVMRNVTPIARWKVSYHGSVAGVLSGMTALGVSAAHTEFATLGEF